MYTQLQLIQIGRDLVDFAVKRYAKYQAVEVARFKAIELLERQGCRRVGESCMIDRMDLKKFDTLKWALQMYGWKMAVMRQDDKHIYFNLERIENDKH